MRAGNHSTKVRRHVRVAVAISAVVLLPLMSSGAFGQAAPAGNAQRGKQIFVAQNCLLCHGTQGQGMPEAGPRVGPPARTFAEFVEFVREPVGDMAPVSAKRVSDANLADIYAFLRSIPAPRAAAPTGNAPNGKAVFTANCAQCHGSQGQGISENGPKLAATARSLAEFIRYVRMPADNMAPISAARVSNAQLADVYAFLQSPAK